MRLNSLVFLLVSSFFINNSDVQFGKENKWFHETVIGSDVYFYYGQDYLCRVFTPPKKFDQMDTEAIDLSHEGGVLLQELKFKKDGKVLEEYYILEAPEDKNPHGPPMRKKTQDRTDVFAEKCLSHSVTLPEGIKELLKRKYQ